MYYEAVLGFILPLVALGIVLASTIFYAIVRSSATLRRRMAEGSRASRELLYGYLGVDKNVREPARSSRRVSCAGSRAAQVHRFPIERVRYR